MCGCAEIKNVSVQRCISMSWQRSVWHENFVSCLLLYCALSLRSLALLRRKQGLERWWELLQRPCAARRTQMLTSNYKACSENNEALKLTTVGTQSLYIVVPMLRHPKEFALQRCLGLVTSGKYGSSLRWKNWFACLKTSRAPYIKVGYILRWGVSQEPRNGNERSPLAEYEAR